jgi:hypothetical protein
MYIASMVVPVFTVMVGCCEPIGSWFSTEFTLMLISAAALDVS